MDEQNTQAYFRALRDAGLSPDQAEWVIWNEKNVIVGEKYSSRLICCITWDAAPGNIIDYRQAYNVFLDKGQ